MKKILVLLLIAVIMFLIIFSLVSRGNDSQIPVDDTNDTIDDINDTVDEVEDVDKEWGHTEKVPTRNTDGKKTVALINFPVLMPIIKGGGSIAYQPDKTLVLLCQQGLGEEAPESMASALEFYEKKFKGIISSYRDDKYQEFDFPIISSEEVEINGYKMIKYLGNHTFTFKGEERAMSYAAYATQLKGNGAYLCWMVIDETNDQSMGKTIVDHADNMAKSLREKE